MEREKMTRWIKHYCSDQKTLLVGEGDFSFAASIATSFGEASNIVATSLDSKEELRYKYSKAMANLERLESLGCVVIHQVNAHTMSQHPFLRNKLFDRIVFNFPHATLLRKESDPLQIRDHQELVKGFFRSARALMVRGGEVHVTHKTGYPYSDWEIQSLALDVGLQLVEAPSFSCSDYPGYFNMRGYGPHFGGTFHVGACRTFVFQTIQWPDDQMVSRACWGCDHRNNMLRCRHDVTSPALPRRPLSGRNSVIRPHPYLLHPPPPTRPQWPMVPEPNLQQFWAVSATNSSQLLKDFLLEVYDRKELQFIGNRSFPSHQQPHP